MRIIDHLLRTVTVDAPVRDVIVGAFWTAVVLDSDPIQCGIASSLRPRTHRAAPYVKDAGRLASRSGRELVELLRSDSTLEASVGMAAFNALLSVDESCCTEVNAADVIAERGRGRSVAIVGHFPFLQQIQEAAARCWVLELNPRPGDLPASMADDVLPKADVVALTGTSLINHTFDDLIGLIRPESYVLLLGPSAPLTPALFEVGVDAVSGTLVSDVERVLPLVKQGANFRQIKRAGGVRLLTLDSTEILDSKT